MFTGIVEEVGFVKKLPSPSSGKPLVVRTTLDGIKLGDSVCVQGVCLTAVSVKPLRLSESKKNFEVGFDVSEETFSRTTFGGKGWVMTGGMMAVNLERALKSDGRVGGHFVSGHIDTVGKISSIGRENNSVTIGIKVPSLRYIVFKGSVAVDGVSLTISNVDEKRRIFYIAIIPHTLKNTAFNFNLKINQPVNIEYDLLAKYALKGIVPTENEETNKVKLTKEKLKNAGFAP